MWTEHKYCTYCLEKIGEELKRKGIINNQIETIIEERQTTTKAKQIIQKTKAKKKELILGKRWIKVK